MRSIALTLSALSLVMVAVPAVPAHAGTSIDSDKQSIQQLEQQIESQGEHAQSLVLQYNQAQARVDLLDAQIAEHQRVVATDQAAQTKATIEMRRVALEAYESDRGTDSTIEMISGTSSVQRMLEQNHYLDTVNERLDNVVSTLTLSEANTRDAERVLQSDQAQAKTKVAELAAAHDAATRAISSEEAQLTNVKGNLRSLLAAVNAERESQEAAAERALAVAPPPQVADPAPVPTTLPPPPPPVAEPPPSSPPPTSSGSSGGYANPLRDASALSPERIDQGVDYSGFGPVYAIGDGVIRNTYGNGWPGGTFIAYQLTDGPASGLFVYVAEDVEPSVQVGQVVSSGTVLGQIYAGPDGIETGWADGAALPDTMAREFGQFDGSDSTAFGINFSQLLESLGAPGGIQNGPGSGVLPAGWPQW